MDTTRAERDFPEDAIHENGNYQNTCYRCGGSFTGHKRRVFCRDCQRQHEAGCRANAARQAAKGGGA